MWAWAWMRRYLPPAETRRPPTQPLGLNLNLPVASCGGRSSVAERLTVAQEVAGSIPVAHPNFPNVFAHSWKPAR